MRKTILVMLLVVSFCMVSFGDEGGKIGILFKSGSQQSIGVSLALFPRVNIRTTVGFRLISTAHSGEDLKTNLFRVGAGIMFDVLKRDDWAIYTGVEFAYVHQSQDQYVVFYTGGIPENVLYERNEDGFSSDLLLGVRHKIGKRVALYGELSLGYSKSELDFDSGDMSQRTQSEFNLKRSGIGVVFYL